MKLLSVAIDLFISYDFQFIWINRHKKMSTHEENLRNRGNNEIPSTNMIKKYVQSVVRPFDLMAALYILSKYKTKNGFVAPNSFFYNVVSGVWSLVFIITYFLSLFRKFFTTGLEGYNFVNLFTNILIFFLYFMENVVNFCTNVMHRYSNVILALRIQNICEMFKVNGESLKTYIFMNWIYLFAVIFNHIIWLISYNISFSSVTSFDEIITNTFNLIFDSNMLYFGRLMKLILQPLEIWVDDVRKLIIMNDTGNEFYWERKFRVYMDIVGAYEEVAKKCEIRVS